LRRALGSKRSKEKMQAIEIKLRSGMEQNGITGKKQDEIVQFITSFALYGFPESHAASFALLAYASAFLKVRYLAAFTCAMLNNTDARSPLERMTTEERLVADYGCTGLTVDYHPLHYRRPALKRMRVKTANELLNMHDKATVSVAGCIIARQRPGTAQGFIFL